MFALHARRPEAYPFLLESGARAGGRYSILAGEPGAERRLRADADPDEFFAGLDRGPIPDGVEQLPFCGGWFLYLAYELARAFEPHLQHLPLPPGGILARAVYCGAAVVVDHQRGETIVISSPATQANHRRALDTTPPALAPRRWRWAEEPAEHYLEGVRRAVDYIHAGDVYQVNLSRRWSGPKTGRTDLLSAYARLRQRNAAPFAASLQLADLALASASPERLFAVESGTIQTRPIAGTRPRGSSVDEDLRLRRELAGHPKERAEHIMLVDLERHDLGRVCTPGSVRVDELEVLESYASVHHLVSNIRGQLLPQASLSAILQAVFPGGTITGCPKIRCMQIIAELEGRARGAYTGSLGYVSNHGRMDFNILIRSLVWQADSCHFDAGAGIVADSEPVAELEETRAKAAGLLRALADDK